MKIFLCRNRTTKSGTSTDAVYESSFRTVFVDYFPVCFRVAFQPRHQGCFDVKNNIDEECKTQNEEMLCRKNNTSRCFLPVGFGIVAVVKSAGKNFKT